MLQINSLEGATQLATPINNPTHRRIYAAIIHSIINETIEANYRPSGKFGGNYTRPQELHDIMTRYVMYPSDMEVFDHLEEAIVRSVVKEIKSFNQDGYGIFIIRNQVSNGGMYFIIENVGDYRVKEWEAGRGKPKVEPKVVVKTTTAKPKARLSELPEWLIDAIINPGAGVDGDIILSTVARIEDSKPEPKPTDYLSLLGSRAFVRTPLRKQPIRSADTVLEEAFNNLYNYDFEEFELDMLMDLYPEEVSAQINTFCIYVLNLHNRGEQLSDKDRSNLVEARFYLSEHILNLHPHYHNRLFTIPVKVEEGHPPQFKVVTMNKGQALPVVD